MKTRGTFLFLLTLPIFAYAQSPWVKVGTNDKGTTWEMKTGSFSFEKTKGGNAIASVIGRVVDKSGTVSLYKWYVSATDCGRQMGKLVSLNVSGEFQFENDFVFDAGNISSALAETICNVANNALSEKTNKGT